MCVGTWKETCRPNSSKPGRTWPPDGTAIDVLEDRERFMKPTR